MNLPHATMPAEQPESSDRARCPADHERMQLLRCMLADRNWSTDPALRRDLHRALAALAAPGAVALDEVSWTLLADETANYLDFRRLGAIEAQLRGCAREAMQFTRADWELARASEAALEAHRRHVRDSSYVPEPAPLFRIH